MSAQLCDVCLVCSYIVRNHHKSIKCNSCDGYVHKKCTNIKLKNRLVSTLVNGPVHLVIKETLKILTQVLMIRLVIRTIVLCAQKVYQRIS